MNEQQNILVMRLKEAELSLKRFFRVKSNKNPDEPEGYEAHLKTPEEMDREGSTRWGIMGRDFLVLIDTDDPRMSDAITKVLPPTFEVKSPRRGLPHRYYVVWGQQVENNHLHLKEVVDANGKNPSLGEIRAQNWYLVAPGTEITYQDLQTGEEKTGQYTVTNNIPIRGIEYKDFIAAVTPFLGSWGKKPKVTIDMVEQGIPEGERHTFLFLEARSLAKAEIDGQHMSESFILDSVRTTASRCNPPYDDEEDIKRMVKDAIQYQSEADEKQKQREEGKKLIQKIGTPEIKAPEPGSLEAAGYAIRPAEKGGGFLLYCLGEKEVAVDIVRDTQKWLDETAKTLKVQRDTLKTALVKAKSTPKKTAVTDQKNIKQFEIVTSSIFRLAPDSGTVNGRAYLGLWLPAKMTTDNGTVLTQVFHLLFSDGELVPGDPETLGERGIYLATHPIYTPLKISVEMALNIADLPRINPVEVATGIMEILKKYIEFDDQRYYVLCAVWIIGTYFHKRFSCYPYLFINAVKRSGKTKLLTVLSLLTYNAVLSANMSTSSLFRLTQSAGATTLADETEDLNDPERKADFRQLFSAGYKRGSVVYRTEKGPNDTFVPTPYDPYSPKGLANINGLEDVLEDRCILLTMKRGRNRKIINRDVPLDDVVWEEARDALSRLYLQDWAAVEHEYNQTQDINDVVSGVSDVSDGRSRVQEKNNIYVGRIWELWRPILSLGKHILFYFSVPPCNDTNDTNDTNVTEPTLFEQLLDLSVDLILEKEMEDTTDTGESLLLMGMLKNIIADNYYKISDLIIAASEFTEALPGWFNPRWIGRALKRLGFKEKRHRGKGVEYRLTPETVKDMADRLGVSLPPTPEELAVEATKAAVGQKTLAEATTATKDAKETGASVPPEKSALEETKKRYCADECKNFRQSSCPVDNYGYRPTDAEIPLRCPSYSYKGAGEEA